MSLFLKARRLLVFWKPMLGMAKTLFNALNLGPFGLRLFLLSTAVLYTTPLLSPQPEYFQLRYRAY